MEVIETPIAQIEEQIAEIKGLNEYQRQFQKHKLLIIDRFIPPEFVQNHFYPEIENCAPYIHRVKVPSFKKSGSVSSQMLEKHAPKLFGLYQSTRLKEWIEKIVGENLQRCPADDPHSVALYHYTEPGDRIGVHYDKSFYHGKRYTVLLGMIQDSISSKLVCYPGSHKFNRRKNPLDVYTHPGTLVIFDGDTLWHEVTALGENEKRVILTMEYVTDNRMTPVNRFISHLKDRLLYFGKK
ncbi:MAG: hypothetical protein A3F13_01330 [Gammaproteobacteria bacterium RIFCSPHIGHO2_12_FULL_40_19]|nr:MAG: hypothetical protein A3F13_01330 [Gammaproteobacteria bacterium RIFCSPHIGHO2_12_FULL_40_19]